MSFARVLVILLLAYALLIPGAPTPRTTLQAYGQTFASFTTPLPISGDGLLVIGFVGWWDGWNDEGRALRKLALRLRDRGLPGLHAETVENHRQELAIELVERAFDRNRDGMLSDSERMAARIVLVGHSYGGPAAMRSARRLEWLRVPVQLLVQVDSVGRGDRVVPANVRRAVNFYQRNDILLRGEGTFRAADPARTEILGNFRRDYSDRRVDLGDSHWYEQLFRAAHGKLEQDPELWPLIDAYILNELPAVPRP